MSAALATCVIGLAFARSADAQASLPAPPPDEFVERAAEVRRACRDALSTDYTMFLAAGGMVATGSVMTVVAITHSPDQRPTMDGFFIGFGGGLLLGGVSLPFTRGLFRSRDALARSCHHLLSSWPPVVDPVETRLAARLLEQYGEPVKPIIWAALVVGTVAVGGGIAGSIALHSYDLMQLSGGLAAAIVTGWIAVVPTPAQRAGMRLRAGGYRQPMPLPLVSIVPTPGGAAVGVAMAF